MALRSAAAGRPDFTGKTYEAAVGTVISPLMIEWQHLWTEENLVPKKTTTHKVLTVPSGYKILLKGGMVAASKEGIHLTYLTTSSPGIFGDCRFRYWEGLAFLPSTEVLAGSTITMNYKSNCTRKMRGTFTLFGLKIKV